ncbi:MAG: FAD-dependent oxidoreductase [Clostridiales bacterium]|jgi:hypothetical protein|nr:FAD-dependent oxidoreductase [Clostridiales bacterium]
MKHVYHDVDLCVIGGGMAGLCAAVAAARHGIRVALMHDRPVLGGNASSEIRMHICGAHGDGNRETGLLEEIILENYYRNHNMCYSIWDSILYEKARFEENITLLLNCTCQTAETDPETGRILSVTGWTLCSETYHTVKAKFFADCSGDSILAPLTGAEYVMGREGRNEFGEPIAPEVADKKTMGMSIIMMLRETDSPQPYTPPEWAYKFPTDADLPIADHSVNTNFWWIEYGGTLDCIHDTDEIRDELLKIAFGVWDHMKNYGDHGCENWMLDWVGFLPGKRESRRYRGPYVVTQHDVEAGGRFDDVITYGGWTMDDHFPEGFYYRKGHPTIYHPAPSPWGIPYRAVYSVNIPNLFFAGRNISVTHTAFSSSRVMGTCAMLGQAAGTAAALAVHDGAEHCGEVDVGKLQEALLWDDCMLPGRPRIPTEKTKSAKTLYPMLADGCDRENPAEVALGQAITYTWDTPVYVDEVRVIFDSDLNRRRHNMPSSYPLNMPKDHVPETLVKEYKIIAVSEGGEEVTLVHETKNRARLVKKPVKMKCKEVKLIPLATWGKETAAVFALDVR